MAERNTPARLRRYGSVTLFDTSFQSIYVAATAKATPPLRYTSRSHLDSAIQRWADPCSLAVTRGIPVGFFSSAY